MNYQELIALYVNVDDVPYFCSFGVEQIPEEIKTFTGNKNIKRNIQNTSIQFNNVPTPLYWIYLLLLKGKSLLDYICQVAVVKIQDLSKNKKVVNY